MVVIKLAAFSGEKPIISARLLPETAATAAADFRLDDGALTPCRKNAPAGATVAADARTIYRHGDQWLSFAKDAFAVSQERQKELDALTTVPAATTSINAMRMMRPKSITGASQDVPGDAPNSTIAALP